MLKICNLSRKYLLQIAETFFRNQTTASWNIIFHRFFWTHRISFWLHCLIVSAQILEKNSTLKDSKENHFVQIFRLGTYKAAWEPGRNFLAELSNVFPSRSEQMCNFLTIPKQLFFLNFCLRTLQFQFGQTWLFLLNVQTLLPQNP